MTAQTLPTQATLSTREVANAARRFARENGLEVGNRGRLSAEVFTQFFLAQPKTAREIAKTQGIPVSQRGRLSSRDAERVASCVR